MNTEAWDELIKLEEEADSILIGPSTAGRVGKYVSKRQRLKAPAAPTETVQPQPEAPLVLKGVSRPSGTIKIKLLGRPAGTMKALTGRGPLPERIRLAVLNQEGEQVELVELAGQRRDLVAAVAKATGLSIMAASAGQFAIGKTDHKADKRKQPKRKLAK